jgi:hypothetical protein
MLAAMALVAGCVSSQLRLVADAKAAQMWSARRFQASCVATGAPPAYCVPLQRATNRAAEDVAAAEQAQKVGSLPPSAIARLKAIPGELEAIR